MKIFTTLTALVLFLLFRIAPVFAIEPPVQSSPSNNSVVTSSTLNWQTPSYPIYTQGSPYVVQIKNIPTFTSQDDRYKTNTYYTPKLSDGIWYWRVKAKNSDGIWSDWSSVWSFTLSANSATTNTTPTISPQTDTPSPTNTQSKNITISNTPPSIDSNQSFTITVNLIDNPNSKFYLKGAFKKSDSSNYFSLTKVGDSWVKNGSNYSNQLPITTNPSGVWSGNLELQADSDDSGFSGSSVYIFKVGKYNSSGSGPSWSNETTIYITDSQNNSQTKSSSNNLKNSVISSTPSIKYSASDTKYALSSSILGQTTDSGTISTPSAQNFVEVKSEKHFLLLPIIGGVLIFLGLGYLVYLFFKFRVKSAT